MRFAEDYEIYLRLARTHELHYHGELVAEYREHGANMSNNYRGMLAGVFQALDAQEAWVGQDLALRRAIAQGRRTARIHNDAWPRLSRLGEHVRAGRWLRACASALVILIRYPDLFLPLVATRVRRKLWSQDIPA